jgi:hypothetical protein
MMVDYFGYFLACRRRMLCMVWAITPCDTSNTQQGAQVFLAQVLSVESVDDEGRIHLPSKRSP